MRVLGDGDEAREVLVGRVPLLPREQLARRLRLHLGEAQHLAQAVVQLPGHPVALAQRGERPLVLDGALLRLALVRDVVQHRQVPDTAAPAALQRGHAQRVPARVRAGRERHLRLRDVRARRPEGGRQPRQQPARGQPPRPRQRCSQHPLARGVRVDEPQPGVDDQDPLAHLLHERPARDGDQLEEAVPEERDRVGHRGDGVAQHHGVDRDEGADSRAVRHEPGSRQERTHDA